MTRIILYLGLAGMLSAIFLCAPQNSPAFQGAGPGYGPDCREPGLFGCIETLDLTETQ